MAGVRAVGQFAGGRLHGEAQRQRGRLQTLGDVGARPDLARRVVGKNGLAAIARPNNIPPMFSNLPKSRDRERSRAVRLPA